MVNCNIIIVYRGTRTMISLANLSKSLTPVWVYGRWFRHWHRIFGLWLITRMMFPRWFWWKRYVPTRLNSRSWRRCFSCTTSQRSGRRRCLWSGLLWTSWRLWTTSGSSGGIRSIMVFFSPSMSSIRSWRCWTWSTVTKCTRLWSRRFWSRHWYWEVVRQYT